VRKYVEIGDAMIYLAVVVGAFLSPYLVAALIGFECF